MKFLFKNEDYYYFTYWHKSNTVNNSQYFVYKECLYEILGDWGTRENNELNGLFERTITAKRLFAHTPKQVDDHNKRKRNA